MEEKDGGKEGGNGWNGGKGWNDKSGMFKGTGKGKRGGTKGAKGMHEFEAANVWDWWGSDWQGREWQEGDWQGANSFVPSEPWMRRLCPLTEVVPSSVATLTAPPLPFYRPVRVFLGYLC